MIIFKPYNESQSYELNSNNVDGEGRERNWDRKGETGKRTDWWRARRRRRRCPVRAARISVASSVLFLLCAVCLFVFFCFCFVWLSSDKQRGLTTTTNARTLMCGSISDASSVWYFCFCAPKFANFEFHQDSSREQTSTQPKSIDGTQHVKVKSTLEIDH